MHENAEVSSSRASFHDLVHEAFADPSSRRYRVVSNTVMWAIFASIALIVIETVGDLAQTYAAFFSVAESIVVAIFVIEYIANVYITRPRRRYIFSAWGIIDIVAVLPSLVGFLPMKQIRVVRVLRVLRFLRILRVLKLARQVTDAYQESSDKKEESTIRLDLEIYFLTMFSVLIIGSALMYYAESGTHESEFADIPTTMWWGITTITTVGYGDMVPMTLAGKLIASLTALCGMALIAMLTQVMGKAMLRGLFGGDEEELDEIHLSAEGREALLELERAGDLRDREVISQEEFEERRDSLVVRV
jgi:voltage-gated potassium channel